MRIHKVVDCLPVLSIEKIKALELTKGQRFSNYEGVFDYALPQNWLYAFADWCKTHDRDITYDMILSTTVWIYPKGGPMTCCKEVYLAYKAYERYTI